MTDPLPPRPTPPKRRRERLGLFFLIIAACIGVAVAAVVPELRRMQAVIAREDAARDRVERLAAAEATFRSRSGRYGWVDELGAAGLLSGLEVRGDDGARWVASEGYRVEVLLPHARLGAGVVAIAPRGGEDEPDPDLVKRHFAVVARPLRPGVDGFRTWYVDERGEVYLNEGVIDDDGALRNDLPTTQVVGSVGLDTAAYLLWQKASEVPVVED